MSVLPDQRLIQSYRRFPTIPLLAALLVLSWVAGVARGQADTDESSADQNSEVETPIEIPFALRPYRVKVSVSMISRMGGRRFAPDAALNDIRKAVTRTFGPMWQADVYEADWLRPGTTGQLSRLRVSDIVTSREGEEIQSQFPESEADKVIFLSIQSTSAGVDVTCREFDTRLHDLSPLLTASALDARGIATVAATLMRDSFRPCLQYTRKYTDDAGLEFMELQAQAGELQPPDFAAEQVQQGDVLRLFLRKMDRRDPTKLGSLREVPLTYVQVLSVDRSTTRGLTTGVLLAHGSVSLFGSRSRNVQHLALRQRPAAASSQVKLVDRSEQSRPLICQRVSIAYKLRATDVDEIPQLKLLSDRNGEITVPAHPDHSTVWIYVYSGSKTLARVPYAPGLLPDDTIVLPDDSIRLSVEGDLQLFQDKLVDSVAMREVQFSLAQHSVSEGRPEEFEQAVKDYFAIPGKDAFIDELALIRVAAVRRSVNSQNRRARRDVEKLCKGVEDTIELFFNDTKRARRMETINQMRTDLNEQLSAER